MAASLSMKPFYDHKYFYDRGCILDREYILDREPFYDRGFFKKPFIIMIHEREPFLFFTAAQKPPEGLSYLPMYYNMADPHCAKHTSGNNGFRALVSLTEELQAF
jgi:hypothetical protein